MTQQRGANVQVLLGFEDVAYGTVATEGFIIPLNSMGVKESQTLIQAQTLTGTLNPVAPSRGRRDVRGQIVIPVDSVALWYWLKAMFGAPVTTGSGPYVHEFKVGSSRPSISLEAAFEDIASNRYQRFVGCKVGGFSLSLGHDGELVMTLDIVGASGSLETSAFDASPTSLALARLNDSDAAVEEGGSSLSNATELSFNVQFPHDEDRFLIGDGGVRGDLPEKIVEVSGNIKTLLEDDSLLDKAENGTESSLKATITGSATSIFEIELQELIYGRNSPDVPDDNGILVDLNFNGYYTNGSETSVIVARLTNSDAHA